MKKTKFRLAALLLALLLALCACEFAPVTTTPSASVPTTPTTPTQPTLPTAPASEHLDDDGDEICDHCGIDVTVELDFYAFNDLHGVFMDTAENPGVDELTTYLKNAYADDAAYEIVLSSGDMWQGSVESSSNKGQLMTEWMNYMGFVSMTLGNHEYDWGSDYIAQNAQLAEFPFLGINVTDSNVDTPYCQSSVVVERGGVKIGIIGAVGDVLSSISGEFTSGISFAVRNELTELVKAEAVRLRQEEGCHLVIYSIHDGYETSYPDVYDHPGRLGYYDLDLSQGYIDLVFESHSHKRYIMRDQHGVYHLQAGGYNSGISFANICYNLVTNTYELQTVEILGHEDYADPSLADDPIVEELMNRYLGDENPYTTVLGRNTMWRGSNEIADTVAQLYLKKGRELWGAEYNVVLGGGFIKTRPPYDLPAGDVTYPQLVSLLPFDNDLVLCSISGKNLKNRFINSSYACDYDANLAEQIVDSQTYYIVTDTYTASYTPNHLTEVARVDGLFARDLLKDFVSEGGWDTRGQAVTISEALSIGWALQDNESTQQAYEVTGTIKSITNTTYGNVYIRDDQGNELYLYGLYDATGTRYDAMENPPQVGDTITVTGVITKYITSGGTAVIEIAGATLK